MSQANEATAPACPECGAPLAFCENCREFVPCGTTFYEGSGFYHNGDSGAGEVFCCDLCRDRHSFFIFASRTVGSEHCLNRRKDEPAITVAALALVIATSLVSLRIGWGL